MEQRKKEGTSNLQEIMDKENITDQELSEKSGVHINTIRLIRTGVFKKSTFSTLRKLAKAMKDEATLGFKLFFLGIVLGTIVMASNSFVLKKENEELRIEKNKLEHRLIELDYKQAQLTKKIAEMNGIGG